MARAPTYSPGQHSRWMNDLRDKIRELEADLQDQGLKLFPNTRAGHDAQVLWRRIKQHLFRGGAVQITASALRLSWHREELRRARNVLIGMELIKRRSDDLYVLGRYDQLDALVRDRFLELRAVEAVMVALNGLVNPVKNPDAT
jgi:hypothetical protein